MLSHPRTPERNRSLHHSYAGGITEILYQTTWPFLARVTGIIPLGFYATPNRTGFTKTVKLLGWIRLHAAKTFCFFWLCSIEAAHNRPEFFISVPCRKVDSADTTIQPTGCHQTFVSYFFFRPPIHACASSMKKLIVKLDPGLSHVFKFIVSIFESRYFLITETASDI